MIRKTKNDQNWSEKQTFTNFFTFFQNLQFCEIVAESIVKKSDLEEAVQVHGFGKLAARTPTRRIFAVGHVILDAVV